MKKEYTSQVETKYIFINQYTSNLYKILIIFTIFIDERARARSTDCAPGPGVLVQVPPAARSFMCSEVIPRDLHFPPTYKAAT